jgi:mannose/fructose/N-acetylgalactosamine-specific phosphotransferase system component IIC
MWLDFLIISLWGGVVAADTTAAFQFMVSHPIVSCAVVGLLLGNFPLGFMIGIILELIWLNEIPTGGAKFSEGNVGATVAAACAIMATSVTSRETTSVVLSLFVAVGVAILAGTLVDVMRKVNTNIYDQLLNAETRTVATVQRAHYKGIIMSFVLGFGITFIILALLVPFILPFVVNLIPSSFEKHLQPIVTAFMGVGCGVLLFIFKDHKYWWLVFIGLVVGLALFFAM